MAIENPPCLEDVPFERPYLYGTFHCHVRLPKGIYRPINHPGLACRDGLHGPLRLFDFLDLTPQREFYGATELRKSWWFPKYERKVQLWVWVQSIQSIITSTNNQSSSIDQPTLINWKQSTPFLCLIGTCFFLSQFVIFACQHRTKVPAANVKGNAAAKEPRQMPQLIKFYVQNDRWGDIRQPSRLKSESFRKVNLESIAVDVFFV